MQVSTLTGSANMGASSSSGPSSSRGNFKTTTKMKTDSREEINVSINSLNSLSSAGSKQRIIINGGPPRDFSRQRFQENYVERHGSKLNDFEMNEMSGFASGTQEDAVSVQARPGADLAKSTRDIIRNRGKPPVVQDSVAGTSTSHDSSTIISKEDLHTKKTTGVPAFMRVSIFFLLLLVVASGIGVLIHFLRKYDFPDTSSPDTATCKAEVVEFGKDPTIVCNTTFKNMSNIRVVLTRPLRAEQAILTSQNPYMNGWSINYTSIVNKTLITLIGPPANCSSGGEYNITMINNSTNTSLSSRITLAVNIYATVSGNRTHDTASYNCSTITCLPSTQCNDSSLIVPSKTYCCDSCLYLQNCTENCTVQFLSYHVNSAMNCTVGST